MIFRNLDANNDWKFGAGFSDITSQNIAIGLNIKTRIQSWVGDCFFDTAAGIDWVNRMGSKNQRDLLELELRRMILKSYGVTGIVDFGTVLEGRDFSANYTVNTIFGKDYQDNVKIGLQQNA